MQSNGDKKHERCCWSGEEQGEKMRVLGEGSQKANVGGKNGRVKHCCGLYLEAPGEERVHVVRIASHAEGEGRGKPWRGDARLSAPQNEREERERGEAESQGQRAGVCERLCTACVFLRRMNDARTTAPLPSSLEYF